MVATSRVEFGDREGSQTLVLKLVVSVWCKVSVLVIMICGNLCLFRVRIAGKGMDHGHSIDSRDTLLRYYFTIQVIL